jgi:putative ABC transport system permease protein
VRIAEFAIPNVHYGSVDIKYNSDHFSGIAIAGTRSEHSKTSGGAIMLGRHFTPFEDHASSNIAVLGYKAWQTIFPDGGGIGETIKIKGQKFTVVGVVKKQGTMLFDFVDNQVYIPITTFFGLFGAFNRSVSVGVKAGNISELEEVKAEVQGLMREIRNLKPGDEDDFSINETKSFEEMVKEFRMWVWGIGMGMTILSFFVGIIGIMNIMFVSVTERTKEIGIRKAIGAKKRSILIQFLVEAATLSFAGAVIAFIVCSIFVYLLATYLPTFYPATNFLSPLLPYNLLIIASIVSIFVGMLAGLIPALRASNLNCVDALRYE